MCKTLHYSWLVVNLVLGALNPMKAAPTPETYRSSGIPDLSHKNYFSTTYPDERAFMPKAFPNPQLLDSVKYYLEVIQDPLETSCIPSSFVHELKQRATKSLIRNGDLDRLETAYQEYQDILTAFHLFSEMYEIPLQAKRKKECRSRHNSRDNWNRFLNLRGQLLASFNNFQKALLNAYRTERLIWSQYQHNPALYQAVNSLINLNGEPLPVYVQTRISLFHEDPGLQHLEGMLVVSLNEGAFSSDTPFIRRNHPSFVGREGAIAVFLDSEADGATLSHEFGHLYYLYHHWESYMKFIAQQGEDYQIGGHGAGDCSGKAADLAEAGKMPNSFMPWAFRKRGYGVQQPLISLADE